MKLLWLVKSACMPVTRPVYCMGNLSCALCFWVRAYVRACVRVSCCILVTFVHEYMHGQCSLPYVQLWDYQGIYWPVVHQWQAESPGLVLQESSKLVPKGKYKFQCNGRSAQASQWMGWLLSISQTILRIIKTIGGHLWLSIIIYHRHMEYKVFSKLCWDCNEADHTGEQKHFLGWKKNLLFSKSQPLTLCTTEFRTVGSTQETRA